MKLLVISNGHGEDTIAVKIIKELKLIEPKIEVKALPMVGEGFAYGEANISIISPVKKMPSGGFIYMDKKQLWGDIQEGLISLTLQQYQVVKQWVKNNGKILAVGDILPLLFAWLSGGDYTFIGTAKSEYYLKNETQWLPHTNIVDRLLGSFYYPWERWLMKNSRCKAVFPRDKITTESLKSYKVKAFDLGNPMMDGIPNHTLNNNQDCHGDYLKILLLPGSRMPEAVNNWQLILSAVGYLLQTSNYKFIFISAIAPSLPIKEFIEKIPSPWILTSETKHNTVIEDEEIVVFKTKQGKLLISQNAYNDCLHYADLAIAMAGTATEQFVGLGKSAIAPIGKGPQYNRKFAQNQTYLLGESVQLIEKPEEITTKLNHFLENPDYWQKITENGKKRMGKSGASQKIAHQLIKQLTN